MLQQRELRGLSVRVCALPLRCRCAAAALLLLLVFSLRVLALVILRFGLVYSTRTVFSKGPATSSFYWVFSVSMFYVL